MFGLKKKPEIPVETKPPKPKEYLIVTNFNGTTYGWSIYDPSGYNCDYGWDEKTEEDAIDTAQRVLDKRKARIDYQPKRIAVPY